MILISNTFAITKLHVNVLSKYLPNAKIPTIEETRVISERQVCYPIENTFAVESVKCKYGFPRAFIQHPTPGPLGGKISSGMLRLSCPHLVKAVDELENVDNAIEQINNYLLDNSTYSDREKLKENFLKTNNAWKTIRLEVLPPNEIDMIKRDMGETVSKHLLESGLIGITLNKVDDVKCLHAHVADHLLRGDNEIGKLAIDMIESKGVDMKGCGDCWQQCSLSFQRNDTSYWYTPAKNKQKLRTRRVRRLEHKDNIVKRNRERILSALGLEEGDNHSIDIDTTSTTTEVSEDIGIKHIQSIHLEPSS